VAEEQNQSGGIVIPNPTEAAVHLIEEKVHAQFSDTEKTECRWSMLETSATNHMTGCRVAFSDLDRSIQGTVKFGNGSVVQIEGMGTMLFC
jgi:hypothetical protein